MLCGFMSEGEKTVWSDELKQSAQEKDKIKIEKGYDKARAHVMIQGMVQGVFFRSTIRSQAKLLEVNGWTRNTTDGHVEAVFEGDRDRVEKIITFCWKGPPVMSPAAFSTSARTLSTVASR